MSFRVYALCSLKRNQDKIRAQKLAEAISINHTRDFWREVKKMKHNPNIIPCAVDGVSDSHDIANNFAKKYDALYNSVSYDETEMIKLNSDIDMLIQSKFPSNMSHPVNDKYNHFNVSVDQVKTAVKRLKLGVTLII